jgi:alkylation response protein AidB-like acyl-CoA dehydrogenase
VRQAQRGRDRAAELGGRQYPSSFHDGKVTTTPGFKEAFRQYTEGGWQGLQHPAEFGGQGLPKTIGAACGEILKAANMSFALCPLLTDGAIEALLTAGSDELKAIYLEKLISGQWTGTMNLTEPQAGSDLAAGAHPRRAPARRHVQGVRHQDLHHLR